MPGPPPPPPPGPPPPSMPKLSLGGGDPNDRSALLKSIQKGTKLKKTVTNDKSAPMIGGKVGASNNNARAGNFSGGAPANPAPIMNGGLNFGEMFANGRPKLKSTGKLDLSSNSNNNNDLSNNRPFPASPQSAKSGDWRRQTSDKPNRGPPPAAPIRTVPAEDRPQRPPQPLSHAKSNGDVAGKQASALHRKVNSNTNLHSMDSTDSINGFKPVISHGKPNLAPKPPQNGKPMAPPKKLITNGKPVSRAHSMKSPRSPSPQSPETMKFGTVRNLASVLGSTLNHSTGNLSPKPRPLLNGRPSIPPPQVPQHGVMPPPPSKTGGVKPPSHAPPPPPTMLPQPPNHTPPPPPHRTAPTRAPPAVPQAAAPPPPPRNSSMANRKPVTDFDERFRRLFNDPTTFPKPPPYRNVFKNYGNRAGSKQQAPQPPIFQASTRSWDTTSAC